MCCVVLKELGIIPKLNQHLLLPLDTHLVCVNWIFISGIIGIGEISDYILLTRAKN